MRRTVILASLAVPLLAAFVLVLIVTRTASAPGDSRQVELQDPAASGNSGAAHASPAGSTRSGSRSSSMLGAPSSAAMPAGPNGAEPGRTARSARAALLAAKLQHLPKNRQSPAPATRPAWESLPPEEVAAMEAQGMDWRRLEQMIRNGVPGEPAAPIDEPPPRVDPSDEEQ